MKDNESNKVKLNFSLIESEDIIIPQMTEKKLTRRGIISWGESNDYPQYLWDLYCRSSMLQSITDGINDFVMGNGLINIDPNIKADKINRDGETLEDLINKIDYDLQIFGGFTINILYDHNHNISELYWVDIQKVRVDEFERVAYISDNWGKYGDTPLKIDIYDRERIEASWKTDEPINSCLFYYKGQRSRGIYPVPSYNGAIESIETSVQINKFHLSNITNNLASSLVFAFNGGEPTMEEKQKLDKAIKQKFAGPNRAGSFMMFFADDKEHNVEVTRLEEDNLDDKFKTLREDTIKNIFIAFRANPILFGMNVETGFSKEEFLQAFELYNKTMISPIQKELVRTFNKIYGVDKAFDFVPFSLNPVEKLSE